MTIALVCAGTAATDEAVVKAGETNDLLPVSTTVDVLTRFGEQHVVLAGQTVFDKGAPRMEDGRAVIDVRVTHLYLTGASQLGRIEVRADPAHVSAGQIRSLQPDAQFPASSFIDLYADVSAPESPLGPLVFHNEGALRLVPWARESEASISAWPPLGVRYRLEPVFGVDNDGDTLVDEDTADDDGDGYIDEDRPGPDPATPGVEAQCGDDADCDELEGEDPPPDLCTPAVCDNDGDGRIDEDPKCVPLWNEANTSLKLGLCVRDLNIDVAPYLPTFSVARDGPLNLHPADLLGLVPVEGETKGQAPFVQIPCASLGLSADGCDDGSDGTQDELTALSFGQDFGSAGVPRVLFSVAPGAVGAPGSAVRQQHECPPAQPGLAPEAEPDVFSSALKGGNDLVFDGNGPIGACTPAFPPGFVEASTARDDLDALDLHDASSLDQDGDGVPEWPVYFTLDADSPSLTQSGATAGDVLVTAHGATPEVYATASQLGLRAGDEIDAFCLKESGDSTYGAGDVVYFVLTPRSPSLAVVGAGPGEILAPGSPPQLVARAESLGLAGTDVLDALSCEMALPSGTSGDVTCDGAVNEIDALLVLQYEAALIPILPCPAAGDTSGDGAISSIDALLILQYLAGLIDHLPR